MYLHGVYYWEAMSPREKKHIVFNLPMMRFRVVATIEAHILQFYQAPPPPILPESLREICRLVQKPPPDRDIGV